MAHHLYICTYSAIRGMGPKSEYGSLPVVSDSERSAMTAATERLYEIYPEMEKWQLQLGVFQMADAHVFEAADLIRQGDAETPAAPPA